ncbi:peptidylprolyl isomerase [Thermodesulfobacteriota bacterium]
MVFNLFKVKGRQYSFGILLVWILSFFFVLNATGPLRAAEEEDAVAVTVNGRPITQSAVDEYIGFQVLLVGSTGLVDPPSYEELEESALGGLIDRELLLDHASREGIQCIDDEIEAEMERYRGGAANEANLREHLERSGKTIEDLRTEIRVQLTCQKVLRPQGAGISVTEKEARKFYKENIDLMKRPEERRVRHILVGVNAGADDEERRKAHEAALEVKALVDGGEDFAAMAAKYSACPSAPTGGVLGWLRRGQTDADFEAATFAMNSGAVSEPVKTSFGYHIIEVMEVKAGAIVPFEELREPIIATVKEKKKREKIESFLRTLRSGAEIVTMGK